MNRYDILLKKKPPKPKPRIRPDWESFGNCTVEIEKTLYKNAFIKEVARSAVEPFSHGMAFGLRHSYGRMIRVFNIIIHAHVFISSPNIPIVVHYRGAPINLRVLSYHSTQNPDGDCYTEIEGEIEGEILDNFPLQL
jgi:hypothetical protein